MPWTAKDAKGHTQKADTPAKQKTWAKIANKERQVCIDEGGDAKECDARAIRVANAAIANIKESGMAYKAYTMSTNNVLIPVNAIDVDGEAVPVSELVAAYEEKTKTVDGKSRPAGDFLVVEDSDKPSTWHLPVKKNGKPDHDLMGAAKAALTSPGGHRGNKYEGPDTAKALKKLKALYKSEEMPWSEEAKEMGVDKDKLRELLQEALTMLDGQSMAEVELAESASGHAVGLAEADASADAGPRAPLIMDVALIRPGLGNKKDRHYYRPDVLKRDAHVFEGVKMYTTDHRPNEKSVRTEVAVIKQCPITFTDDGAPIAQVAVHDGDFAEQARNRQKLGTLETLECSILAMGITKKGEVDGEEVKMVEAITSAQSVDWVTKAGAGGHAVALAESNTGGVKMDKEQIGKLLSESDLPQDVQERLAGGEYEDEEAVKEAILKEKQEPAQEPKAPQVLAESEVEKLVEETKLPSAFKAALKATQYADEDALKAAIAESVKEAKALTGSGRVFAQGGGEPAKDQPLSEREKTIRYNKRLEAVGAHPVPVPAE